MPLTSVAVAALLALSATASPDALPAQPLLVVLRDTGATHGNLPVVERDPDPGVDVEELSRGFAGRLLRLYQLAQRFVRPGVPPQPAYLVLSGNQGGFARTGFYLDGRPYAQTSYVDLRRARDLTNRFGATNQIFPHELMHVVVRDLAGPPPSAHDNQIHAVGVRTDRATAFSEGFAEHVQVLAVEAADAAAATSRLPADENIKAVTRAQLDAYRRAVTARWAIAPKATTGFPLWFSANEQVLRYHAVRANLFAREPQIPGSLRQRRLYHAYLLDNVLPGDPAGRAKRAARMVATEGVVSALFYRLVVSADLQHADRDDAFYRAFGVTRADVDPLDNVYLKLFAAIREGGYDSVAIVDAYVRMFPEERAAVQRAVDETLLGQPLPRAQPLWMLNDDFQTGTSLFDQRRNLPRSHTFDLNAASLIDLMSVPGVSEPLAGAIERAAPFSSVEQLRSVAGVDAALVARFARMHDAYRARVDGPARSGGLSLSAVLYPYLWRAGAIVLVCAAVSGGAYRLTRRVHWFRAVCNGVAAAALGLLAGWTVETSITGLAVAAPMIVFGLPAALIAFWRTRSWRAAGGALAAWSAASVPALLVLTPIG